MEIFKAETQQLDKAALEGLVIRLEDEFEDTEDIRDTILGQSGQHISGKNARKFEIELELLREKLNFVKDLLAKK